MMNPIRVWLILFVSAIGLTIIFTSCSVYEHKRIITPQIKAYELKGKGATPNEAAKEIMASFGSYENNILAKAISHAMRQVFGLKGNETAKVLKSMGFSYFDIATAMKETFDFDAIEIAILLQNFNYYDIANSIRQSFEMNATEIGQLLKDIGLPLVAVARTIKDVFDLSESELHLALSPILIESYAPIVHFHPREKYLISSVDWYLDGTTVIKNDKGKQKFVTSTSLAEIASEFDCSNATKCWLEAKDVKRTGHLDNAKTYVHVYHPTENPNVFDLQFWLFYPHNGPGTLYTRIGELWDNASVLDPIGSHSGDWESITIRFSDDFQPLKVFLSQHGDYPAYSISELETVNGLHVNTYASLNGHANYRLKGNNAHRTTHLDFKLGHFDVDTYNRCSDRGLKFASHENYEIVALDGKIISEKFSWIEFNGRWGPEVQMHMDKGSVAKLLWDHFWMAVTSGCAVGCSFVPIGYAICLGVCTGGATAIVEIARDDIVNAFYPGGLVSNGPTSPGIKNDVWEYEFNPK